MKLEEFVSESLGAIYKAVKTAQEKSGVPIAEADYSSGLPTPSGFVRSNKDGMLSVIDFDIAVTVENGVQASGGAGGMLTVVGIGAKGQINATESTVSRIRFSIPVKFLEDMPNSQHPKSS